MKPLVCDVCKHHLVKCGRNGEYVIYGCNNLRCPSLNIRNIKKKGVEIPI